ncbi:MAG: tRNA (N6-isopentenyl adenosine(37)-C2)-methylthiotransferase MiaB [Candidatus Omnitrophica bacterium]|nr:tRNA (N6-isopentenyl adenosine(37)-C2)-methylthiotransferase MiaB [Candidatus Omnitrophota bacterium]
MNVYDSGVVEDMLTREGYEVCQKEDGADVVIVNTCSVRQHAEDRACGYLREAAKRKKNKDITLVVMGCMAQREGEKLFKIIPELDIVCGTDSFRELPGMLEKSFRGQSRFYELRSVTSIRKSETVPYGQSPALKGYVSVMRGCNNWCSYCVVPGARGKEKSRAVGDIRDEVKKLVDRGVKEVTMLGQNINAYGKDNGGSASFVEVLEEINKIEGLLRIKFITSHPRDIKAELFTAMKDLDKVVEYLHLPIQAGSDRILKLMNRGYTVSYYMGLVEEMRKVVPGVSLGTDFIVGFPGETEEEFKETLKAAEDIGFDMAYMYKYSQRPGTKAFEMKDTVEEDIIKERHQELLKLQEKISLKKNRGLIGKEVEVLVEGRSKRNIKRLAGRDRGNRMVVFEGSDEVIGKMVSVTIYEATSLTLYGEKGAVPFL